MLRVFDLHAHPGLKVYYLPWLTATLHALTGSGRKWNPVAFQTRYGYLQKSPVKVLVNAHYVIEPDLVLKGFRWFSKLLFWGTAPGFLRRVVSADPWETLLDQIDHMERSVRNTNRSLLTKKKVRILRSPQEIESLSPDEIGFIHAVEGAHALGFPEQGQSREDFWEQTRERLELLRERGVAMIGLAHFFDNPYCPQTEATEIVPKVRQGKVVAARDDTLVRMRRARWRFGDPDHLAEELVRELLRLGILIDVSHVQEQSRTRIYDLCAEQKRPVVASHVGLRHFFNHEYNLSDREILRFRELGGVIGLILSKRWLVDPVDRYYQGDDGIPCLIENMRHIREVTGDVEAIALGTDFDGLTHPFSDCYEPSQLDRIAHAMRPYFSEDEIDRVLFGNSLRVFRRGWTGTHARAE
ncbi:MAG: dipeptidase [Myxococcota bacterium]